jgi:tRNA U34 2-thiouridine synthase MnmA/TrmU
MRLGAEKIATGHYARVRSVADASYPRVAIGVLSCSRGWTR